MKFGQKINKREDGVSEGGLRESVCDRLRKNQVRKLEKNCKRNQRSSENRDVQIAETKNRTATFPATISQVASVLLQTVGTLRKRKDKETDKQEENTKGGKKGQRRQSFPQKRGSSCGTQQLQPTHLGETGHLLLVFIEIGGLRRDGRDEDREEKGRAARGGSG